MVMYLPVSSIAYFIYGKNVQSNILLTKSRDVDNKEVSDVINQVVEVLITIHLILGLLIVINPFCQELESYARVPRRKSWLMYATPYRALTVRTHSVTFTCACTFTVYILKYLHSAYISPYVCI